MYAGHFGLQQEAFSIAPDPRFLFLGAGHREALAHLLYGLQAGGGFVLLTGEIGSGKTTVCRGFLDQMPPGHRVAYVYNPQLSVTELLQTVAQEFDVPAPADGGSIKAWVDALNRHLLQAHARGDHCLLVIDEAQGLSAALLEQLRLLTNLETHERKLLQIVLIGQPELRTLLARPELEQLAQRIVARVHLGPLNTTETADYVRHRLAVAGLQGPMPFDAAALKTVHRLSDGVPRRINLLCQRALLGAYGQGTHRVTPAMLQQAAHEVQGQPGPAARPGRRTVAGLALATAVLLAGAAAAWAVWHGGQGPAAASAVGAANTSDAGGAGGASSAHAAGPPPDSPGPAGAGAVSAGWAPHADEAAAWPALAAAWQLPQLPPAGDREAGRSPCERVHPQQLACHSGDADAALLRRLGRPALVQLPGQGWGLLTAAGPGWLHVQGRSGSQALPAGWSGRFVTLWRPPPGWTAGSTWPADTTEWVRARLALLQGEARSRGNGRAARDDELRQRVFAFQVAQQLPLDGVAGPLTLMQLNRASGVDEPRLGVCATVTDTRCTP